MKKLRLKTARFEQLQHRFADWLALTGYGEVSIYNLPNYLREFLHWLESQGATDIAKVTGKQAKAFMFYVSERANQRRTGGLSNNHLNKYIQSLKLFSKYLRETGQGRYTLDMNMLAHERPYMDGTKEILTRREIKELFKACDYTPYTPLGLRDKAMLAIFYGCGLRRNEGVHLDVNDLLFDKELVYVRKGKQYRERYVPMHENVRRYLTDYLDNGRPYIVQGAQQQALFVSDVLSKRMQGQSLLIRLKRLREKSDCSSVKDKQIGLHTLRHSIATHLLQSGMNLQDIAGFLGHKTMDSTQIYTHIKYNESQEQF